ncbi:MAG: class I SAM-dependent methyltransferase [Thermoleophilaceae bacterium]
MAQGRALELGSASGVFMEKLRSEGWTVDGIEPGAEAAAEARRRGFTVHCGPVETAPPPHEPYDLVVGWMVIEHLHEPLDVLQRLSEFSRPGAKLAISVPNAASQEARVFGDAWFALQLPTHLFHYSPRTIRMLLEAGGWRTVKVSHQRNLTNLVVSVGYRLQDRRPSSRVGAWMLDFPHKTKWHYATFPLAAIAAAVGQTGRMTIWAERV